MELRLLITFLGSQCFQLIDLVRVATRESSSMKQVYLTKRGGKKSSLFALVDDDLFDYLNQYSWYKIKRHNQIHAYTNLNNKTVYMHQLVLPITNVNLQVDHKDLNGLNNQKENLRSCTNSQNSCNKGLQINNKSGFKGVWFAKGRNKYMAYIQLNGKRKHLGCFTNKEDTAKRYNKAALVLFGEFALLNVVEEVQA